MSISETIDRSGGLDDTVLLRFAHISRNPNSGGLEQYLDKLNRLLLERNRITIIQMFLDHGGGAAPVEEQKIGRGRLLWVPTGVTQAGGHRRLYPQNLSRAIGAAGVRHAAKDFFYFLKFGFAFSHRQALKMFDAFQVDLVAFHWLNYDSDHVIARAVRDQVPFVVVNHFDNGRFSLRGVRKQIRFASGLAGISRQNVPGHIRDYVNLSDGLDTDFFDPGLARPVAETMPGPVIFLPSRIVAGKGHADILRAASWLAEQGIKASVVFAGHVSSDALQRELNEQIAQTGLTGRVRFLGRLDLNSLRDWYSASDVVVLPSYSEGLGRTLLEAQSMEKPVVAYNSGGIADAVAAGQSGYLVNTGDWKAMAGQLKLLLTDKSAATAMGEFGRRFILKEYSLPAFVERHEKFYRQNIMDHRTGSPSRRNPSHRALARQPV